MTPLADNTLRHRHRCWAEIDLGALERNLGRIRAALPHHIRYVAVVKADAYGHGIAPTVARLMQCGADYFAVANVYEGADVREIGAGWPILLLSPLLPEEDRWLIDYNLIATVSSAEEVERLNQLGREAGRPIPVHLKIDTGMGRQGVWWSEAKALLQTIEQAPFVSLDGIYTHFSSADTDRAFTLHQRQLFLRTIQSITANHPDRLLIHADNSAGLESFSPDSPFNAVRVGLLQFGLIPYPDSLLARLRAEPVLSFHSRIGLIKKLPAGTGISYGQTHRLVRDTRVAIITAGYGDGIPTAASNRASILINGQRCPVLGRVTMDQIIVDIDHVEHCTVGDTVTFIGHQKNEHISVLEFSAWADSIPWEVFCSITKRVPRVYKMDRGM